jgi:hypothetical protein
LHFGEVGVDHFVHFFVLFAFGAPGGCCVAEVDEELFEGCELGMIFCSFSIDFSDDGVMWDKEKGILVCFGS